MRQLPQFDAVLELPDGSDVRPNLSGIIRRLGRTYRVTLVSLTPANDAAKALCESPTPSWEQFRGERCIYCQQALGGCTCDVPNASGTINEVTQ